MTSPRATLHLVVSFAMAGSILACGSSDGTTNPELPVPPPLESVPFAALGSGKVAFQRMRADAACLGCAAIYVIDAAARRSTHPFGYLGGGDGPALSPDGRRIAFRRLQSPTHYDVFVANIDGSGVQQVTRIPEVEGPPSWTFDGERIVYTQGSSHPFYDLHNIFSQSPVPYAGDMVQLTHFRTGLLDPRDCPVVNDRSGRIAVSPQGAMAFVCGLSRVEVLAADGTPAASYATSRNDRQRWPNVFAPAWSPDGTRLAFLQTKLDATTDYSLVGMEIKIMNADGRNVTTLATVDARATPVWPEWSGSNHVSMCWMPDGSRLVFNVPESELVSHLWVARVDGTAPVQLTSAPNVWDRSVSCSQ